MWMKSVPWNWEVVGIGLLSASALLFEISLTRLFALQQFHHFAFVVISLALMGFAASGTMISIWPRQPSLYQLALAFCTGVLLTYIVINIIPFDSYSIVWDPLQLGVLLLYFLVAGLPFLFAGWAIGLGLSRAEHQAHTVYGISLGGSAIGCLIALVSFQVFSDFGTIALVAILSLTAAIFFNPKPKMRGFSLFLISGLLFLGLRPGGLLSMKLSPYKPLSIALHAPDANQTISRWGPSARIEVVESQGTHVFPGMSFNNSVTLPDQVALFVDGDGPHPITAISFDNPDWSTWSSYMPSAIAYQLRPGAEALLLRPGTGLELLVALGSGADRVSIAQDQPEVFEILRGPYREFSGDLLGQPRVEIIDRASRGALRDSNAEYDIVHYALSEPYRPIATGAFSLGEYYPLTVESLEAGFQSLHPGGLIVITQWLSTPPSESARAWATLLKAMERLGIDQPSENLIAFRGMRTATILGSIQPFTPADLETVRSFMLQNGYDPIILPDLQTTELNQFNRLPMDYYHQVYTELLQASDRTIAEYPFNLQPPTDNQPYFYHFFRLQQTPEVIEQLGQIWLPFGGSGYLVLFALLLLMLILAIPIIILPVIAGRTSSGEKRMELQVLLYFGALGSAYLLVEIPLIQELTLLLDQPATSLAAVLFILLLSSGIGSLLSTRLHLNFSLFVLTLYILLIALILPILIHLALPWSLLARLLLVGLLLFPLGLLMGIPFAAGLRRISHRNPQQIPWAWAINGAASGVIGVITAMVTLGLGFSAALLLGAIAYFLALLFIPAGFTSSSESVS